MRSTKRPTHLFVYGTLRHGFTGPYGMAERTWLHKMTSRAGTGVIKGTLYDLGAYPGLAEIPQTDGDVIGDILRLTATERAVFRRLDAYEGISPDGRSGEYRRIVRLARLGRQDIPCWVYILRNTPRGARVVRNGDWITPSLTWRHR